MSDKIFTITKITLKIYFFSVISAIYGTIQHMLCVFKDLKLLIIAETAVIVVIPVVF